MIVDWGMTRARTRLLAIVMVALAAIVAAAAGMTAQSDLPAILVSRQLAVSRGLHVGDTVQLSPDTTRGRARPFRIADIYEPTPDPLRFAQQRHEVRLHLPDLLSLMAGQSDPASGDSVTAINVALKNSSEAPAFARELMSRLPTITARPTAAADERTTTFVVVERFHLAIAIVTIVGSAIFLLALMVMLIDERRATVGTLRLLGFSRGRILAQVMSEGAIIAVAGAAAGVLFAVVVQGTFNRFFQWRYDTPLIFLRVTPGVVWRSLLLAIPLGIASSVIASWALLRQQILGLVRR
jgi:ABC-type lipoprotein release transport system permease subunit